MDGSGWSLIVVMVDGRWVISICSLMGAVVDGGGVVAATLQWWWWLLFNGGGGGWVGVISVHPWIVVDAPEG